MKPQTLPVKRKTAPKGILKRLSAVTGNRKQRVAAAAAADMEMEDTGTKISRALTIIFLMHIVAIGLIIVHKHFLDGRPSELVSSSVTAPKPAPLAAAAPTRQLDLPKLSTGDRPYLVRAGDNYARIAAAEGVDENDLRLINKHAEIRPGIVLILPPARILAKEDPQVTALRETPETHPEDGLVDVETAVANAPRAQLVRPNLHPAETPRAETQAAAPEQASGKSYVVQPGDSIWRIANRFKVNQEKLMKANNISDARKVKPGTSLVIPR